MCTKISFLETQKKIANTLYYKNFLGLFRYIPSLAHRKWLLNFRVFLGGVSQRNGVLLALGLRHILRRGRKATGPLTRIYELHIHSICGTNRNFLLCGTEKHDFPKRILDS